MDSLQNRIDAILSQLQQHANPDAIAQMARYGITPEETYGVKIPVLRQIARDYHRDHELALRLWSINTRETRILASMVDNPKRLSEAQMDAWAADFDYWEICDQCCMNLFEKHPLAWEKAVAWSRRDNEGQKRAGFVLMARLAVSAKEAASDRFLPFFRLIENAADDPRNLVKKAVNWALRQIGKRNLYLNRKAIRIAERLTERESKSARWIGTDARRELTAEKIQRRLKQREARGG